MTDHLPPAPVLPPPSDSAPRRKPRKSHRRSRRKALVAVLLALLALVGMGTVAVMGVERIYDRFAEGTADYDGPGSGEVRIRISLGDAVRTIGRTLQEAGVVQTEGAFVAAARDEPRATALQPGYYRLKKEMRAVDALAMLLDPNSRILTRAVVAEGRNAEEIITLLARESGLPLAKFREVLKNPAPLGLPGWAKGNPEGFLFPRTYDIEPDATPLSILKEMTAQFRQAMNETDLVARAAQIGRTPYEVLTIASLIEEEAKLKEDFGKVSRVIYNRLEKKMKLQLDSTVLFAVGKKGSITTTAADRATDSPYNTYKIPGLPVGPVSSPGKAAIEAALSPTPGPWLYFVTVDPNTGETKYGVTAADHARNVAEFQKWLRENP